MSNPNDSKIKGTDVFRVNKFNRTNQLPFYVDGSDALANKKQIITFYHVNSNHFVAFKAFITAYNEAYSSDWASEPVYGRADPIYMFKNTTRKITLAFKVPAATVNEAYENLTNVQKLLQYLYPNYKGLRPRAWDPDTNNGAGGFRESPGHAHANTIAGAPLVRLGVMNLARRRDNAQDGDTWQGDARLKTTQRDERTAAATEKRAGKILSNLELGVGSSAQTGLLGAITNINVNHNLEGADGVFEQGSDGGLLPKMIEVNVDFSPIHESFLGWLDDGTFGNSAFPYGANDTRDDYYFPALTTPIEQSSTGTGATTGDENEGLPSTAEDDPADQASPSEDVQSEQAAAMSFTADQAGGEAFAQVANAVSRQGGGYTWTEGWGDYSMNAQGDISWTTGGGGTAAVGSEGWQAILTTVKSDELKLMEQAEQVAGFGDDHLGDPSPGGY